MPTLINSYKRLIKRKNYHYDTEQEKAILVLQNLLNHLNIRKTIWSIFRKKENPKGVYLHGGVGRGKSMIMDLFYKKVPVNVKKRRVHFHEFMIETHDWLHKNRGEGMDDLLLHYAAHVRKKNKLICFDEFHITDVADAMILKRLFTALLEKNIIIVSTSNWAPDNLYEGGLRRDVFIPFIKILKSRMFVVQLDGGKDYRAFSNPDQDMYYFYPRDDETKMKLDTLFAEISGDEVAKIEKLSIKGRTINVMASGDVARFTFYDLCEKSLGAEDYITIAQKFDTIFIENIPALDATMRNEAKRFIVLIDCLYEAKCRVIISAEKDLHKLYTGSDHAFEFDRTISRLLEMQSHTYHQDRLS